MVMAVPMVMVPMPIVPMTVMVVVVLMVAVRMITMAVHGASIMKHRPPRKCKKSGLMKLLTLYLCYRFIVFLLRRPSPPKTKGSLIP